MSEDAINPVRFLHVVCDFGFERRILLHISWGLMLDGFVKVMACFRNVIYSSLYSCILLEKLALSNRFAILPAAFSIALIVVSWAGAYHTWEFRISEASNINAVESSKRFWRQLTISSTYQNTTRIQIFISV